MPIPDLTYLNVQDKSLWERGPWDAEPDKAQWSDEDTGYPCLILRGPSGALCGYVGVSNDHPAYGLNYNGCTQDDFDKEWAARMALMRENHTKGLHPSEWDYGNIERSPIVKPWGNFILNISVHGGLTYSGASNVPTHELYEQYRESISKHNEEAGRHPHGDAAEWLKEWLPYLDSYDKWAERYLKRAICVIGDEKPWLFGFDCCHAFDLAPQMEAHLKMAYEMSGQPRIHKPEPDIYRPLAYVKGECASLAKQLKGMLP